MDVDSFRIYIKGTNFPGLTMQGTQLAFGAWSWKKEPRSRAFGDTACAGVLQARASVPFARKLRSRLTGMAETGKFRCGSMPSPSRTGAELPALVHPAVG